jgi:membrane protein DedA with SNARE-associated domain
MPTGDPGDMPEKINPDTTGPAGSVACPPHDWVKTRLIPILALVFVIGIAGFIFYLWRVHPQKVEGLKGLGYLGVFLISLGLNATVLLPAGNFAAMATLAATLPPVNILGIGLPAPLMVGLIGGLGAGLGESTGYVAGYSGQAVVTCKKSLYERLSRWLGHWGMLFVFVFSIVPLIFDVVGLVAGALRYPYWKFLIACWLGRTVLYIALSYAGLLGWEIIVRFFT